MPEHDECGAQKRCFMGPERIGEPLLSKLIQRLSAEKCIGPDSEYSFFLAGQLLARPAPALRQAVAAVRGCSPARFSSSVTIIGSAPGFSSPRRATASRAAIRRMA
ncbi:MAG TPA: hypothetical protein VI407_00130 [Erythrobacter sp.]